MKKYIAGFLSVCLIAGLLSGCAGAAKETEEIWYICSDYEKLEKLISILK